jgi:hypothetical protein
MSVRLSVCDFHWTDFHEICFMTSQKSVGKIQGLLKFDKISGTVQNIGYCTKYRVLYKISGTVQATCVNL